MFAKLGSQNTGADVLYGSPLSPLRSSAISRPWRQLALNLCDPRNSVIQAHTPTILPFSRRPIPQSKDPLPVVAARRTSEENPQEICQGRRRRRGRDLLSAQMRIATGGGDLSPSHPRAHPGIWPTDHVDIRGRGRLWPKT